MHYVYILKLNNGMFYTGITWDVTKRVWEHNHKVKTCLHGKHLPAILVHTECFNDKIEAARREKEIKGWNRLKKEKLIGSVYSERSEEPS